MLNIKRTPFVQTQALLDRNLTDLLKFVSCIMVALSHYSGYVLANGVSTNIIYKVIAANGGYIGVAVFFFLSGYGLTVSDMKHHLGLWEFCKRRLSKTYIPAVLVSTIWLGVAFVFGFELLSNPHFPSGLIWIFNDEVMWFVRIIIILYAVFYAYRQIGVYIEDHISSWVEPVILIALIISSTLWTLATGTGASISAPMFFIGIAIAQWNEEIGTFFKKKWGILLLAILMICVAYIFRADNKVLHSIINYFCIVVLLTLLASFNIEITSLPKWIGSCSYDLYLVHYKVHLLIVLLCGTDEFWMFIVGTAFATAGFRIIRYLLRI